MKAFGNETINDYLPYNIYSSPRNASCNHKSLVVHDDIPKSLHCRMECRMEQSGTSIVLQPSLPLLCPSPRWDRVASKVFLLPTRLQFRVRVDLNSTTFNFRVQLLARDFQVYIIPPFVFGTSALTFVRFVGTLEMALTGLTGLAGRGSGSAS